MHVRILMVMHAIDGVGVVKMFNVVKNKLFLALDPPHPCLLGMEWERRDPGVF